MAAIVTNANAYQFAIGKQTNGTTALGTAAYAVPVFEADVRPVTELAEIVVTDASSIQGDPYRKPTYWQADVTVPAMAAPLGSFISGLWGTDTLGTAVAGTAYTHTFTGLGGTQPWFTVFDSFTNANTSTAGTATMSYAHGICSELTFSADQDGGPLKVAASYYGTTPSQASYSVTSTANLSTDGYLGMQLSSATVEIANATPNSNPSTQVTNVESFSLTASRNISPAPTADSVTIANLQQGKLTLTGSLSFYFSTWQEWKASYFGSITGSSVSSTIVYGALDLNFKHSLAGSGSPYSNFNFELYAPKVSFYIPNRQPDASGAALKLPVELHFATPASGEHLQPILTNGVNAAY